MVAGRGLHIPRRHGNAPGRASHHLTDPVCQLEAGAGWGQAALGALIVASFGATGITVRLIEIRHNSILRMQFFEAGYLGMNKLDIKHRQLATMTLATLALALGFSAFLVLAGPGCNRPLNSAGP